MFVEIKDKTYMVQWKHYLPLNKSTEGRRNVDPARPNGGTDCTLYLVNGKEREEIFKVKLSCFHKDQFNYEDGRIKTLTDLLNFRRTPKMKKVPHIGTDLFIDGKDGPIGVAGAYFLKPSGEFNDDGMFNREERKIFWQSYIFSKLLSDKDLKGEYERISALIDPFVMKLQELEFLLGMGEVDTDLEKTSDDEPRA